MMKKFFLLISLLTTLLYFIETNENIGLSNYKPLVNVNYIANHYILTWSKIPYLAYYEVEVLNHNPGKEQDSKSSNLSSRIAKYRTFDTTIKIDQNFPDSTYLRVSAHSLFHQPLGLYSDSISISEININHQQARQKPIATTSYPQDAPAPSIPLLKWTIVPGAVYYEIEFLSSPAENPNDVKPSVYQISSSREVFTNAYSVDLTRYPGNHLYWRVRALNFADNPIGVFSDVAELFIDHTLPQVLKPISNTGYKEAKMPMPLYPVYSWIPIPGAVSYEVEVTTRPPENPNGIQPSKYQIRQQVIHGGSDCYDEEPLITPGTYYWRVRGLDNSGKPIGVYSDAEEFVVDLAAGKYAATLGDSISHGGGAISYSPADLEYSFQTYLSFPTINLAKSGDTSETMLERFNNDVLPYHPKFLIIMGGSNSLRGGVPATQVIKELAAMRDKCLANGIRPIFLTLPPINPNGINQAFNEETVPDWQKQFADVNSFIRQQRYYIDLEPYFMDENHELPPHYATDGLHLDSEGKKLMGLIINSNWAKVTK
ncbi:GDSL-type esterase/lipase family protein [Pelosinus sp. sgz500959]|uniref:SGNH/GDSL hydrolase family protein n=1 Tax=Pelosinus sp. sgz500959 TaxID=3242472 RepID=UPI0036721C76